MAKRFALSFGLDALKNREAITALHRDAILFATNPLENPNDPTGPPPNLAFLEIGAEFTNKLLKQDKRMVLQFLDRILTMGMPSSRGEEWQPLLLYRNSLVHGETDLPPQTARRAYGRRRRDAGMKRKHLYVPNVAPADFFSSLRKSSICKMTAKILLLRFVHVSQSHVIT